MWIRYFGDKEKLFAEAADFDLRLPDLTALPRTRIGAAFVEHLLERWEEDDSSRRATASRRTRWLWSASPMPSVAASFAMY